MNLCIIARADLTGLGIQSRNWVRLLNPKKLVVINSTIFNKNEQHLEWYGGRGGILIDGFIKRHEITPILRNIDVLLTFEIPYSYDLIRAAKVTGVKTIIQNNWEFTDYLKQPELPLPDLLVNHSYWHLDEQKKLWPDITDYCPTPLFVEDYNDILKENLERTSKRRFLHVAGRRTYEDRNGTNDLIEAMNHISKEYDFELVIKTQSTDVSQTDDPRIVVDNTAPVDEKELYRNFDAMIMPRRYGGACLPMNEALASGLPVIMPNIEPNNKVLPAEWLIKAERKGSFMTRTMIDVYSVEPQSLASKISYFATCPLEYLNTQKAHAREIAEREYSSETVKEKWALLMEKLEV